MFDKAKKATEAIEETPETEFHPADFNKDGHVTKTEKNLYDFMEGVMRTQEKIMSGQSKFYQEAVKKTQSNSIWTILGSMVFLLVYPLAWQNLSTSEPIKKRLLMRILQNKFLC